MNNVNLIQRRSSHDLAYGLQRLAQRLRGDYPDFSVEIVASAQRLRAIGEQVRRLDARSWSCMWCPRRRGDPPDAQCKEPYDHFTATGDRYVHGDPNETILVALNELCDSFVGLPWFIRAYLSSDDATIELHVRGDVQFGESLSWGPWPVVVIRSEVQP